MKKDLKKIESIFLSKLLKFKNNTINENPKIKMAPNEKV